MPASRARPARSRRASSAGTSRARRRAPCTPRTPRADCAAPCSPSTECSRRHRGSRSASVARSRGSSGGVVVHRRRRAASTGPVRPAGEPRHRRGRGVSVSVCEEGATVRGSRRTRMPELRRRPLRPAPDRRAERTRRRSSGRRHHRTRPWRGCAPSCRRRAGPGRCRGTGSGRTSRTRAACGSRAGRGRGCARTGRTRRRHAIPYASTGPLRWRRARPHPPCVRRLGARLRRPAPPRRPSAADECVLADQDRRRSRASPTFP